MQAHFSKIGRSAITMQFEVYRADRPHASRNGITHRRVGRTSRTMKPRQIPDDVREKLLLYAG